MIRTSRVVRNPAQAEPVRRGVSSQPLSVRKSAREFEARALAQRLLEAARRERSEEERAFAALLEARLRTIASDARREASSEVVMLAGLVAERLVGELAQSTNAMIVRLASDVVNEARITGPATLAVAAVHAPAIRAAIAEGTLGDTLSVIEDEALRPGDVVLHLAAEKSRGRIDGRVEMRVSALLRVLARHFRPES